MNTSISSPPTHQIYHDPTSPPPTPRKRLYTASTKKQDDDNVPFFFPCNRSVFGNDAPLLPVNTSEEDLLHNLTRLHSTIRLQLKPRPGYGSTAYYKPSLERVDEVVQPSSSTSCFETNQSTTARQECLQDVHLLPPPPLFQGSSRLNSNTVSSEETNPIASSSTDNSSTNTSKKREVTRSKSETIEKSVIQKLPPIQRSGLRSTVDRRNSMVARCAWSFSIVCVFKKIVHIR